MGRAASFWILALCFLLSGLAALIYQTAWTREFAFVFGTSELAVATVLAAYMGGLAAGAALAGRWGHRIRRPVLAYGLLELGVGLAALAVPLGVSLATALLLTMFGGVPGLPADSQLAVSLYYLAGSFAIVMVPTIFMGATLPLLARHAVHEDAHLGSRIGTLYAINTAGAVAGTLISAFYLLPTLGLRATVWVAVALNGLVFVAAALLARRSPLLDVPETPSPDAALRNAANGWILPVMALSGAISFVYEVMWTRILTHLLGGSVYAFATMLASFLTGITLGSALASRLARERRQAIWGFGAVQLGAGLLTLAAFWSVDALADFVPHALDPERSLARSAVAAMAVLLPATLCIGATFPLAVRIFASGPSEAGRASARVYAWNTAGAIVGAVSAAYLILPMLGFENTVRAGVLCNLGLAAVILGRFGFNGRLPRAMAICAALAWIVTALFPLRPPYRVLAVDRIEEDSDATLHFAIGRSATVLLEEAEPTRWKLQTNGLPEATISSLGTPPGNETTARWLSVLPALLRPDAKSLVVIGLGGGVTVEQVPESFERVHVIELEPEVVAANRRVGPLRMRDPFEDPRVEVLVNDARSALLLTGDRFDAIVSQASHPWTAGSSHLYTQQFFDLMAARLGEDGVFVQWMGAGFVDESLLRSLVATLRATWPYVRVYRPPPNGGLLFAGSATPFGARYDVAGLRSRASGALDGVGVASAEDLATHLVLDEAGVDVFAAGAPIVSDNRNLLQMRSPWVAGTPSTILASWPEALDGLDPLLSDREQLRTDELVHQLLVRGQFARAERVVESLPVGRERELAGALVDLAAGRVAVGERRITQVLATAPGDELARATLLERRLVSVARGALPRALETGPVPGAEAALVAGLQAAHQEDWDRLRTLDPALAAIQAGHPLAERAALLRGRWRVALDEPPEDVLAIVDPLIPRGKANEALLMLRVRAAARLRAPETLLSTALRLSGRPRLSQIHRVELRRLVSALPESGPRSRWRSELIKRLQSGAKRRANRP